MDNNFISHWHGDFLPYCFLYAIQKTIATSHYDRLFARLKGRAGLGNLDSVTVDMITDYFGKPNPRVYLPSTAIWFWTQGNRIAAVCCLSKQYDRYSVSIFDTDTGKLLQKDCYEETTLSLTKQTVFKYFELQGVMGV